MGRGRRPGTALGVLITQRSQVQILPPATTVTRAFDLRIERLVVCRGRLPADLLTGTLCASPVRGGHIGSGSWVTAWGRGSGRWATPVPVGR